MENTKQKTSARRTKLISPVDSTYILHRTAEAVDAVTGLWFYPGTAVQMNEPWANWIIHQLGSTKPWMHQ